MEEKLRRRYGELRVNIIAMSELPPPREVQDHHELDELVSRMVTTGGNLPLIPYSTRELRDLTEAHERMKEHETFLSNALSEGYFPGVPRARRGLKELQARLKELKELLTRLKELKSKIDYELEVLRDSFELQNLIFTAYLNALRTQGAPKEKLHLEEARIENYLKHFRLKLSTDVTRRREPSALTSYNTFGKENS